jgi:putative tricarboxylic transport membrane protein
MAKNNQATKALHFCFLSSAVGGIIGVFVLIFFSPILADFALGFGPSHLFWVAILGVTVIATLDSSSMTKGLASGALGLWLSTIGYDDVQGVERFVVSEHLQGGIHIIPALIGLFAIPQILSMYAENIKAKSTAMYETEKQSIFQSAKYCLSRYKAMGVGSVIGTVIGLIPGAGGQIAGLVSWDQVRKISKNPKNFGKGEPDGVIAAESANNAMVGPSLVPLLTLSVPGSPTAAVLLGGLLIHGIFPGPNLFRDYPEVSWTFIDSMLVGQILMAGLGILLSGVAVKVLKVPKSYLAPMIMVLAIFGTYSVQHSYSDVLVMLSLGLAMFVLEGFGLRSAPLVLGLVLGPIAETNFVQGTIIAKAAGNEFGYFLTGTLNLTLIGLCVSSILYSLWSYNRQK